MTGFFNDDKPKKITPKFHNCIFNCGLPIIFSDIQKYVVLEQQDKLPKDDLYQAHCQFKELFAQHYEINNASLSWQDFAKLLGAFDNNYIEQLMIAPIIRLFLQKQIQITPKTLLSLNSGYHFVYYTKLKHGNYSLTLAEDACHLFYNFFKINLKQVQGEVIFDVMESNFPANRTLTIYHNGIDHYELSNRLDDVDDDSDQLPLGLDPKFVDLLKQKVTLKSGDELFACIKEAVQSKYRFLQNSTRFILNDLTLKSEESKGSLSPGIRSENAGSSSPDDSMEESGSPLLREEERTGSQGAYCCVATFFAPTFLKEAFRYFFPESKTEKPVTIHGNFK